MAQNRYQKYGIDGLSFVSGGLILPDPSELLNTQKMKEFLTLARAKFDFVLVDTPPIAILADAIIVSRLVDGVIMVAEDHYYYSAYYSHYSQPPDSAPKA